MSIGAAAHVDIGVRDGRDQLGYGHVVRFELVEVGLDIEFLGRASPRVHFNHAGDHEQAALDDPVLDCSKIGQTEVRGPTTW